MFTSRIQLEPCISPRRDLTSPERVNTSSKYVVGSLRKSAFLVLLCATLFLFGISLRQDAFASPPNTSTRPKLVLDRGEGGLYRVGEQIKISFSVERDAYLMLIATSPSSRKTLVIPNTGQKDNFFKAGLQYTVTVNAGKGKGMNTLRLLARPAQFDSFGDISASLQKGKAPSPDEVLTSDGGAEEASTSFYANEKPVVKTKDEIDEDTAKKAREMMEEITGKNKPSAPGAPPRKSEKGVSNPPPIPKGMNYADFARLTRAVSFRTSKYSSFLGFEYPTGLIGPLKWIGDDFSATQLFPDPYGREGNWYRITISGKVTDGGETVQECIVEFEKRVDLGDNIDSLRNPRRLFDLYKARLELCDLQLRECTNLGLEGPDAYRFVYEGEGGNIDKGRIEYSGVKDEMIYAANGRLLRIEPKEFKTERDFGLEDMVNFDDIIQIELEPSYYPPSR
jgi:hypothetical protein